MSKIKPRLLTPGGDHAFRLPKPLAEAMPLTAMSGVEWRVLGCLLWFAWAREVWGKWDGETGEPHIHLKPKEIAEGAGFAKSRGNREVWAGLHGLAGNGYYIDDEVDPFLEYVLGDGGFVHVKFSTFLGEIYHKWQAHYGLMYVRHIAKLKKGLDVFLYFRMMLVAQQRSPVFKTSVEDIALVAGVDCEAAELWRRLKPVVLGSVQRVARVTSAKVGVEVSHSGERPGLDRLRMLVRHVSETSSTRMQGAGHYPQCWEVTGTGIRETICGRGARK